MKTSPQQTTQFSLGETAPPSYNIVRASQPTILNNPVFSDTVVTTLPYLEVWSKETFPYLAVMIDHDCLVGRFGAFDAWVRVSVLVHTNR